MATCSEGYREGHSGLEYKEWLDEKGEKASLVEDAPSEGSLSDDVDGSSSSKYVSAQEERKEAESQDMEGPCLPLLPIEASHLTPDSG